MSTTTLPTLDPDLVARWYADALAALRELETGGDFVTPMATTVVLATAP